MRLPTTGLTPADLRVMRGIAQAFDAIALGAGMRQYEPGRLRSVPYYCADRYTRACAALSLAFGYLDWQVIGDNLMAATMRICNVLATITFGTSDIHPYTHWVRLDMEKAT